MLRCARGPFTVQLTPQSGEAPPPPPAGTALGRMTIAKRYEGELVGAGTGEMLTAMTPTKGSAAYVAVERVEGTLFGRAGSFALHHSGIMARGEQRLTIGVVPDSGTGELAGISGRMVIVIDGGRHSYEFEYELPGD